MKIKTDSRKVLPGDTFIALRGIKTDGHKYVKEAIKNGASLVIVERGNYDVDTLIVNDTHEYLINYLKDNYYDEIKNMKLIGITGTNGKTTSCYILATALNKFGIKCGYIGTIGFYIEEKICDLNNTTPDILEIYDMLIKCHNEGCRYVTMEISSQALAMNRVSKVFFDYAVFTNLTEDHLDYHIDMKNYALAKQKLFKQIKKDGYAIINIDDDYKNYFLLQNNNVTYGFNDANYKILSYKVENNITKFSLENNNIIENYETKLLGKYNVYNLVTMIIILKLIGLNYNKIKELVYDAMPPSGRMETIVNGNNKIIVDYAHTPDAVQNILSSVKDLCVGRIITIIGCGGNRDKTKRPEMALVSTSLSDYVIFTSDNPRGEKPEEIINDMIQKLDKKNYEIEINRYEAIKKGIQMLKENDILLVLGKGHEDYQIIGDKKYYFSDKNTILDIL